VRVAQFSNEYPPRHTGGLGTYLGGLVAHLRAHGDEVDVFFLGDDPPLDGTIHVPAFARELLTYSRADLLSRCGGRDHDVVVCHDWMGVVASQGLWRHGVPLVYTSHLPLWWDIGWYDDIPCPFAPEVEVSGLLHADRIIVVSGAAARDLHERWSFTAAKTVVVPNGTDPAFFRPPDGRAAGREATVLYAGRFVEQKGFDLLPDIFAAVSAARPDVRLEIAGIGKDEAAVRARLRGLGLAGAVRWHGFTDPAALRRLYRSAGAVVMPSRREPFGLVAVEAMACGAPLVAADVGGLGEIVRHGETGLLVGVEDVRGFADGLLTVLGDPPLAAALGEHARQAVARDYDQRVCFARTRAVYEQAAG
jgi:glycosyltransferase involved in cell wall biosynthesis